MKSAKSNYVVIESPWKELPTRETYLARCLLDSIRRGEVPLCGHGLYTRALDDDDEKERIIGLTLHCKLIDLLVLTDGILAVYKDHGISTGMLIAINYAKILDIGIEYRSAP